MNVNILLGKLQLGLLTILLVFASSLFAETSDVQKNSSDSGSSPEATVENFYRWYITHDAQTSISKKLPEIYQFVAEPTIERLQGDLIHGTLPHGVDYFTKVQDYDVDSWLNNMTILPAVTLSDVTIVPASFAPFNGVPSIDIVLYLRQINGNWRIIKAEDAHP